MPIAIVAQESAAWLSRQELLILLLSLPGAMQVDAVAVEARVMADQVLTTAAFRAL